jgi:hypothetical protein
MSTYDLTCQLDACPGKDSEPQAKLAIIFGVLDSFNGLLGILVAAFVGYLQFSQMRQLNRRQPAIDEPQWQGPAPQNPVEGSIKAIETAA